VAPRRAAAAGAAGGACSHGRHCHSTPSLTVIGCHSSVIYVLILLPVLSVSVEMAVLPVLSVSVDVAVPPRAGRLPHDAVEGRLVRGLQAPRGKMHRVDPEFWVDLTFSNRDSQSNCWVNWKIMGQPCEFQVLGVDVKAIQTPLSIF
jgi:hypothetical protein